MKLEMQRLILRTPRMSDWKDIVEGIGDPRVVKFLTSPPYPYRKKDALEWIQRNIKKSKKRKSGSYHFMLELKSKKKVIGSTGLVNIDHFAGTAESGSWIAKPYQGKGYITEAKLAVNDFAFDKLGLRRIQSAVIKENVASNAMAKRFGYRYEGTLRKHARSKSTKRIHDINVYGLLKEDWKRVRSKLTKGLKKKNSSLRPIRK